MSTAQQNCSSQSDAAAPTMTQRGQIVSRLRHSRAPYRIKCCHYGYEDLLVAQTLAYDTIEAYEHCATELLVSKRCYSFEDDPTRPNC